MTAEYLLPFVFASALLLATPGPTILLVISYALAQGRSVAIAVVLGVVVGDFLAMSATLFGLGVVLSTSALLFTIIKWCGAAYLCWMGIQMIRTARQGVEILDRVARKTRWRAFQDSMVVTLLNPKSTGFFLAFVPQFIDPTRPTLPQFGAMIAIFVGLGGLNAIAYALMASQLRRRITRPSVISGLRTGGGVVLIAMAAFATTLRRA